MNEFTIYCTPEQTKKAFKIGAPIEEHGRYHADLEPNIVITNCKTWIEIPTAEQMIGWLEEQDNLRFEVATGISRLWHYYIHIGYLNHYHNLFNSGYSTRKEATLASIDAALDYLIEKKEK